MADEDRLGPDYVLNEELGRTAWTILRRCTVLADGSEVMAKILRPEVTDSREVRGTLLQEEATLRRLGHESIVQPRDLVADRGLLALVLEYVDGEPLGTRVKAWSAAEARAIGAHVAAALAAAHEVGVTHSGLSPRSILIVRGSEPPRVKVTGFGVSPGKRNHYSAPETGDATPSTAASDVFSLGAILVELAPDLARELADCTGGEPDSRPSSADLATRLNMAGAHLPDVPGEVVQGVVAMGKVAVVVEDSAPRPMKLEKLVSRMVEIERATIASAAKAGPELSEPPADPRRRRMAQIAVLAGSVAAPLAVFIGLNINARADMDKTPGAPSSASLRIFPASALADPSATVSNSGEVPATLPTTDGYANRLRAKQCVQNRGTVDAPVMVSVACRQGVFYILRRFDGPTTGEADAEEKCAAVPDYTKWYFEDSDRNSLDFVLCLREMRLSHGGA